MPFPLADQPKSAEPNRSSRRAVWFGLATTLAVAVGSLRFEGRRWWCWCGGWNPWTSGIKSNHTSQHFIDPYSFTHLLHGLLFYAATSLLLRRWRRDARLLVAIAFECGWEVIENSRWVIDRYRGATIALGYQGDSVVNSLGDVASCWLGFLLARAIPVRWSIVLFLGVEAVMLVSFRDNLLLNMIMLIYSFDAIRAWQANG